MEIFDKIQLSLDPGEVAARLRFDPARAGFESLDELIALAQRLIRARAVYEGEYAPRKCRGMARRPARDALRGYRPGQHESRLARGLADNRANEALLHLRGHEEGRGRALDRQPAHGAAVAHFRGPIPFGRGGVG